MDTAEDATDLKTVLTDALQALETASVNLSYTIAELEPSCPTDGKDECGQSLGTTRDIANTIQDVAHAIRVQANRVKFLVNDPNGKIQDRSGCDMPCATTKPVANRRR